MDQMHGAGGLTGDRAEVLDRYDASHLIGLNVVVVNAARRTIDEEGEEFIEVPRVDELAKAVAVARCLIPVRLRGAEIRAVRHILDLTGREMAKKMDDMAPETLSRWESGAQPMGGYAEKVFRLLVCEELKAETRGVRYAAKMIADMHVVDPWQVDSSWEVPPLEAELITMVLEDRQERELMDAWKTTERQAA